MANHRLHFPPRKILVPLDLTPASAPAWRTAKMLAASFGAQVQGLYVQESFIYPELPPSPIEPKEALARLRKELGASDEELGTVVGAPGMTILNWGRNLDFDLIVMGTHGRTGLERLISGSVAEEVVRRSEIPVLVVRKPLTKIRSILCPVNFQPYAEKGLAQAAEVAQALAARLTVLHVVDAPVYGGAGALKGARHMLADAVNRIPAAVRASVRPKTTLTVGRPADEIAHAAQHDDLVALVAHRRGFMEDALLGTTAERLLRHCKTAILALPAGTPAAPKKPKKDHAARPRKPASVTLF
jgi:nucleotide-binding universal stress UspA family protein